MPTFRRNEWCVAFDGNEPPPRNYFDTEGQAHDYGSGIVDQCAALEINRTYKVYLRRNSVVFGEWEEVSQ